MDLRVGDSVTFESCAFGMGVAVPGMVGQIQEIAEGGAIKVYLPKINAMYNFAMSDLKPATNTLSPREIELEKTSNLIYSAYLRYWDNLVGKQNTTITELGRELQAKSEELWEIQHRIVEMNTLFKSSHGKYTSEANRLECKVTVKRLLESTKGYTGIEFNGTKIIATTKPVIIEYKGFKIPMGKYTVVVDVLAKDVNIQCVDSIPNRDPHPHINGHGNPCWGSYTDSVGVNIANSKHLKVLELAIDFLWSVYEDGWYTHVLYWLPANERSKICMDCFELIDNCSCEEAERCEGCDRDRDDCECMRCPDNNEIIDRFPDEGCYRCRTLCLDHNAGQWECRYDDVYYSNTRHLDRTRVSTDRYTVEGEPA